MLSAMKSSTLSISHNVSKLNATRTDYNKTATHVISHEARRCGDKDCALYFVKLNYFAMCYSRTRLRPHACVNYWVTSLHAHFLRYHLWSVASSMSVVAHLNKQYVNNDTHTAYRIAPDVCLCKYCKLQKIEITIKDSYFVIEQESVHNFLDIKSTHY